MRDLDALFEALSHSAFRRKFRLQGRDLAYLQTKGMPVILDHARDFIHKRVAPALPDNDGKQTPFRGHPVFVAQHATACCCRGCLAKWHKIAQGQQLSPGEEAYIVAVLERWLQNQLR